MSDRRRELLRQIEEAFAGVELGDGVSLHETIVIDDYGTAEERSEARRHDEKHDWRKLIDDPELLAVHGIGGPNFFDDRGFRFHLPAYLSVAVVDLYREDADVILGSVMFNLSVPCERTREMLAILNGAQRRCVYDVLVFLWTEYEFDDPELECAIDDYWSSACPDEEERRNA